MSTQIENRIVVVAMYHFVQLDNFVNLKAPILKLCVERGLTGTILLASEGLNGTVAGPGAGVDILLAHLLSMPCFKSMRYKKSYTNIPPFRRMKVRLKREIVTMGTPDTDPDALCGKRVNAEQWNRLLDDPTVITIDTRNTYEYEVGTFKNSISSNTKTFRDFPKFVNTRLDPKKHQRVAMFCTGGIRCEKASSYMIKLGFKEVYHLDGGILNYLETVDKKKSQWQGECFVFDDRVAINEDLTIGSYILCHACRLPLAKFDLKSPFYEVGISCHHCHGKLAAKKIVSLKERQRQHEMAKCREKDLDDSSSANKKKT